MKELDEITISELRESESVKDDVSIMLRKINEIICAVNMLIAEHDSK